MLVETITTIGKAVAAFLEMLLRAIQSGNDREFDRVASVMPEPLKTELTLRMGEEKARRAFDKAHGGGKP